MVDWLVDEKDRRHEMGTGYGDFKGRERGNSRRENQPTSLQVPASII